MPKEIIRSVDGVFDLQVSWGAGGHDIQVATVLRDGDDGPSSLADLIESWSDAERRAVTGLYSTLHLDGINDMVRVGKRAREQVFLS